MPMTLLDAWDDMDRQQDAYAAKHNIPITAVYELLRDLIRAKGVNMYQAMMILEKEDFMQKKQSDNDE